MEMDRNRESSLCLVEVAGRFWTETVAEERFSNLRVEEALGTGAEVLVTGCPFCVMKSEDSLEATGKEVVIQAKDVAEILTSELSQLSIQIWEPMKEEIDIYEVL